MATLQADDIVDLITITQRDLGKLRWTDLSYDLQEYIALPSILQKEKVTYGSGFGMQWNVMTGTSGATKDVGLYEVDSVNVADVMTTANVPWRHMTTNYAIERREIAMNTGAAQIVDGGRSPTLPATPLRFLVFRIGSLGLTTPPPAPMVVLTAATPMASLLVLAVLIPTALVAGRTGVPSIRMCPPRT